MILFAMAAAALAPPPQTDILTVDDEQTVPVQALTPPPEAPVKAAAPVPNRNGPAPRKAPAPQAAKAAATTTGDQTKGAVRLEAPAVPLKQPMSRPQDIGYFTGTQLVERCKSSDLSGVSYCYAYIAAVHDTIRAYEVWLGQSEFCAPAGLVQADLRQAFMTYLSAYPKNGGGQAASVILVALKQTYPCMPGTNRPYEAPAKPKRR